MTKHEYRRAVIAAIEQRGITRDTAIWMAWDGGNIVDDGWRMDQEIEQCVEAVICDRPSIVHDATYMDMACAWAQVKAGGA